MGSDTAPHVVVVPRADSGHTIPFLQFSRRLAYTGVVTTVVVSDRHALELESSLGTLTAFSYSLRIIALSDKTSLGLSHGEWQERVRTIRSEELRVIELLETVIADLSPPVCILHDMFECWAQEVADRLHIPKHLLYVSPASALSCALQSLRLYQQGLVPITRENRDRVFSDIPGLPPTAALDLPTPFLKPAMYAWMQFRHAKFRTADVILLNTFHDIESGVLDALRSDVIGSPGVQAKSILDIGPLLPESYVNDDEQSLDSGDPCIDWLNIRDSKSVLYVSFGSGATNSAEQLLELADGLEASGVSFLWIVRPPGAPGFSAASATVSVTEFLPVGFQERVKDRGLCYSQWAPQMRILKHPAVGGFLSHCGWNSTLETVCAGVPVLAWPKFAEQHLIRRFLVDTVKAAIELKGNPFTEEQLEGELMLPVRFVSKEEIAKKARSLMLEADGEIVRENVRKLRMKAREAGAPGGSSRSNFEAYVSLIHDTHLAASQPC